MINQRLARAMRSWQLLLPTAVVLAGATGVAIAGPATKEAPKGVTVYTNHGGGALPNHGKGYLPQNIWPAPGAAVAFVHVPPGNFVIHAKIGLSNLDRDDNAHVKCSLRVNRRTIDTYAAYLTYGEGDVAVLQGTSSSTQKNGISLWCAYTDSKEIYAESQALTAIRVSSVDDQ